MKKLTALLISALLAFFCFAGCGRSSDNEQSSEIDNDDILSKQENAALLEENFESQIPDFILEYHKNLSEVIQDNSLQISIQDEVKETEYSYDIITNGTSRERLSLSFYKNDDATGASHNCRVWFDMDMKAEQAKEYMTAILMVFDPTLTLEQSKSIVQEMSNQISAKSFGEIKTVGNYSIALYISNDILSEATFEAVYDANWDTIAENNYQELDYDIYSSAKMNMGCKMKVTGEVISWEVEAPTEVSPFAFIIIKDEQSGKEITGIYPFAQSFISFSPGDYVTLYGTVHEHITGESTLWADKIDLK